MSIGSYGPHTESNGPHTGRFRTAQQNDHVGAQVCKSSTRTCMVPVCVPYGTRRVHLRILASVWPKVIVIRLLTDIPTSLLI